MKKRIVFVLALVFALGLFGCSNGKPKVWEWTQSLSQKDIISVTPWRHDAERKEFEPLSDEETLEIVTLLNELTKDNFTHNKHLRGGTPTYGIKIVIASETYYLNQANGPHGSLEIEYNGKLWWIDNAELSDFVQNVTDSKPVKDEQPYSEPVGAPPAEHFSTVQEVVEHIKTVKAAGVEETVSSNHVVLYDKEYIYALKESPLPDYQHETVTLIIEGINIRYLADEHLSEDQVNFWWFKEYTDENVENLTRRYNLKQYKDTKFFFWAAA